jgi:hypothetical protein
MRAAQNLGRFSPSPTNWEVAQLHQVGRLSTTSLVEDGGQRLVPNPWPTSGFPS